MKLNDTLAFNVKYYRKQAGLNQKDFAEKCGFSRSLLEKLETGKMEFSRDHVNAAAFALSLPASDLFQPFLTPERGYFRANKKMKDGVLILNRAERWVRDYHFLEQLLDQKKPFALSSLQITDYSDDGISRFTSKVREALRLNESEPIQNLCDLVEDSGIHLLLMDSTTDGFFGFSLLGPENIPAIVVNSFGRITQERRIFSLAHEFGHVLLHLSAFGPCQEVEIGKDPEAKKREKEADLFAGAFLMPENGIRHEWNRSFGMKFFDRVLYVKEKFKVSCSALLMRLAQLKIEPEAFKKFNGIYQKRTGHSLEKNHELNPLQDYAFRATRFRKLVFEALEKEEITVSRAAEMLQCPIEEILGFTQEEN